METIYDFVTVALFAGLIVLFLQRSLAPEESGDAMWQYLVASVGCAVANYLGNEELHLPAVLALAGTVYFILHTLKPFPPRP